ncbi:hypothetical protein ACIQXI_05630 [Lysinibacillus sp. NPDC097195]|uniref:TcaA NTF2-like domain-containing protein n=1 Tax=Lysinibacillus sp. NPDC097195 TaxID=3364141 RepID=UPI0038187D26
MRNKMLIVGAATFLLTGCSDPTVADMFNKDNADVKTEKSVVKQEEKLVPEVKVVGENAIGAGIIVKKEPSMLYIVTNGALVASKPTALVQFSNDKLVEAEVRYMSTAYNIAVLQVQYKADVNVPSVYNGKLDDLAVYIDGLPHTIKKYTDKVAAYYIDAEQALPPGSPVMEAENGQIVGIYFNRQQQGVAQPYILPLQDIDTLLDEWITDGMKAKDRLSQSKNLYAYSEEGDKEAVQQAIKKYGKNVFAYNADEVKLFIDTFHEHLKAAVAINDASVMKTVTGAEDLQHTLDEMVAYYASKQAKIHFSNTTIKRIEKVGQNIVVRAKTEYVLTNSAGQEALANSIMTYEIFKNDQGEYKLIRLIAEE